MIRCRSVSNNDVQCELPENHEGFHQAHQWRWPEQNRMITASCPRCKKQSTLSVLGGPCLECHMEGCPFEFKTPITGSVLYCNLPKGHAGQCMNGAARWSNPQSSAVDHPAHYGGANDPYEHIKVAEAWKLGYCLGNATKYICRAGKKGDELEDLRKAEWFLKRRIQEVEKERNGG